MYISAYPQANKVTCTLCPQDTNYKALSRCTYSQCMPYMHLNNLSTERRHICITATRLGTCLWNGRPCATKCGKNDKAYIERVPGSEQSFKYFTKCKDMMVSRVFASLAAAVSYSLIFPRTSWNLGLFSHKHNLSCNVSLKPL